MTGTMPIQGVSFASFYDGLYAGSGAATQLHDIAATKANYVAIVPTHFVANAQGSQITSTIQTESDSSVVAGIKAAHAQGLSVMLKPHIDLSDGTWRGNLQPANVSEFFKEYKAEMLDYAKIAADNHVELLSIGCELKSLTGPAYQSYWNDIIDSVKTIYKGPITYAAVEPEAQNVSFWSKLDYVGVDVYPALATTTTPTVQQLVDAWYKPSPIASESAALGGLSTVDYLHNLATTTGKPVIMTEIGFRSVDGAAENAGDTTRQGPVDQQEQADLYQAMFKVWSDPAKETWMKGLFIWNWNPIANPDPTSFTPVGKLAEQVMTDWFSGKYAGAFSHQESSLQALSSSVNGQIFPNQGVYTDHLLVSTAATGNLIAGATGTTTLFANGGAVHLFGGTHETVYIGGAGQQYFLGGSGKNVFTYLSAADSTISQHDSIGNFHVGQDVFDLHLIDANPVAAGLQSFTFLGNGAFTGAGHQLHVVQDAAKNLTYVEADLDGDKKADLHIEITGLVNLTRSNFWLTGSEVNYQAGENDATLSSQAWTAYAKAEITTQKVLSTTTMTENLTGGATATILHGDGVANTLTGSNGPTEFVGGYGADHLNGGSGKNTFTYLSVADSTAQNADTISNFHDNQDVIDLHWITKDPGMDNHQALTFIGANAFSGTGHEVHVTQDTAKNLTYVEADVNGHGQANLHIAIAGLHHLSAANFWL